jgi:hypothetical protein
MAPGPFHFAQRSAELRSGFGRIRGPQPDFYNPPDFFHILLQ